MFDKHLIHFILYEYYCKGNKKRVLLLYKVH
jgi:hypothetical protein